MSLKGYYNMIRNCKDKRLYRYELVKYASDHSIKKVSREFNCSRNTVRKWARRWKRGSLDSLEDISHAPHNPHHSTDINERKRIIKLKNI